MGAWEAFLRSIRESIAMRRAFNAAMRDEMKRAGILAHVARTNALLGSGPRHRVSGVARNGHRP